MCLLRGLVQAGSPARCHLGLALDLIGLVFYSGRIFSILARFFSWPELGPMLSCLQLARAKPRARFYSWPELGPVLGCLQVLLKVCMHPSL